MKMKKLKELNKKTDSANIEETLVSVDSSNHDLDNNPNQANFEENNAKTPEISKKPSSKLRSFKSKRFIQSG